MLHDYHLCYRYTISGNLLMRIHLFTRGGNMDRWTAIGSNGFRALIKKMYKKFSIDDLDFALDITNRKVENTLKLPNYYYRDDGLKMWNAVSRYVYNMVTQFYQTDDDVIEDNEVQNWIQDIFENGFPSQRDWSNHYGLPGNLTTISELSNLVTKVLFTCTCSHAATHVEAMDMYAHLPGVPALMRAPPPTLRGSGRREVTIQTLPDQSPELYFGAMGFTMTNFKAQEVSKHAVDINYIYS